MFPITYREIQEMVRRVVMRTVVARAIVRKSGVMAGSGGRSGTGALILATPPVEYVSGGTVSTPV